MLAWRTLIFCLFCFFFVSVCLSDSATDDVTALLSFKYSLTDNSSDPLSSWAVVVNSSSSHSCFYSWLGVTCDPSTGRVTKLVLEGLNLTGSADFLTRLTELRLLSLKNNLLFSSSSSLNLSSWPHLKHLYLSHNRFAGEFPSGLSSLRRLLRVDLSYNVFRGEVPMAELTRLPSLLTLRLEGNCFTGTLNSFNSSSILDFNVSNNRLSGEIPAWMSSFGANSFAGNKDLCGRPLPSDCFDRTVQPEAARPTRKRGWGVVTVLLIVTFDAVAIVAAVVTATWCCHRRRSRSLQSSGAQKEVGVLKRWAPKESKGGGDVEEEMVMFEGCSKGFRNVGDLLRASAELLGKGRAGSTYKVVGGDLLVVKRIIRARKKRREVDEWLTVIGGIRQSNVVALRACCNGKEELFLVYDYLPSGSLHSLLHGNRGPGRVPVDWNTRLKLVSDSAKGLAFLHGHNKPNLFHGHNKPNLFHGQISSSNILVDQLGNACISDIGVHQLLQTAFHTNDAYDAPELKLTNNHSCSSINFRQKCDVYSFGVVLLEVLTGKMASEDLGLGLVKWVQRMGPDESAWEVYDFELRMDKEMEEEMRALMLVALQCLASFPEDRPKMSIVHRMIEDIRVAGSNDAYTNSIMNNIPSDSSSLSHSENL